MEKIKRKKHPDRVSLRPETLEIIKTFITEVSSENKGLKLNRNEFVNWLVENKVSQLDDQDKENIVREYFDEERFFRQILFSYKKAKSEGDNLSLDEFLQQNRPQALRKKKSRKTRRKNNRKTRKEVNEQNESATETHLGSTSELENEVSNE